ncbi:hypothetical protein B0H13DRAFT_2303262 [Mycena leptocephala]|nr:hypothetical protein B0H13DRAFT_2303262 [Mycena leptocephala]
MGVTGAINGVLFPFRIGERYAGANPKTNRKPDDEARIFNWAPPAAALRPIFLTSNCAGPIILPLRGAAVCAAAINAATCYPNLSSSDASPTPLPWPDDPLPSPIKASAALTLAHLQQQDGYHLAPGHDLLPVRLPRTLRRPPPPPRHPSEHRTRRAASLHSRSTPCRMYCAPVTHQHPYAQIDPYHRLCCPRPLPPCPTVLCTKMWLRACSVRPSLTRSTRDVHSTCVSSITLSAPPPTMSSTERFRAPAVLRLGLHAPHAEIVYPALAAYLMCGH